MRKTSLLFSLITCLSFSQNKQILYGFSEIPQSLLQNPGGLVKNDWYFGLPLLSHIHASGGSSGISIYDLFAKDEQDFNIKLQKAVNKLKPNDFFTLNQQLEIFSGGFAIGPSYNKNKYLSFGLYQETDFIAYFPKDVAILALEGNANNINKPFQLNHINFSGEVLSVFHLGYNKKVNRNFTYGVRGKIYSSIVNVNSTKNRGSFITTNGENNFYSHIFNLDFELRTSGLNSITEDNSEFSAKDVIKRTLLGGNLGLGFDVGFTYNLTKQWTVDASLLDVGFVRHNKDIKNYEIDDVYNFEGINPLFPETSNGQTAEDYWNEVGEAFKDLFEADSTTTKYTTWRPIKLNASLNYAFGKKKYKDCKCLKEDSGYQNAVGMQLYTINRPKQPQVALTAYYYRRLFNGLSAKATYTIDSYSFNNVGLGVSAYLGPLNFYVMADNFLQYKNIYNTQSVSLQLGFNYIFNKNEN
ncbi:DUF5723 family protein [Sabulilitoribacter arenilitoris]|uniref:DUF5723 family protein n=1 Tax=Wocania arenilitoris TaxID=2044858 RepID=A0AAE3EQ11_9FLAO|nr:DUF5723 family protein [Wocania arenilitoris]MCF7569555.1 DUF5723 family protein [Wocania arenilitoris]